MKRLSCVKSAWIPLAFATFVIAGSLAAWRAADGSFANLWLTPDQQGDRLAARRHFTGAAKRYRDPLHRGVALYRAGDFKSAAAEFGRSQSAEGAFNRGNALVMLGKYEDAIASYDTALVRRPNWSDAKRNRAIAVARDKALHPPNDGSEGTEGQVEADEIVFDNRPKAANNQDQTEVVTGGALSDDQVQALWLRRVQVKPADFLRLKFAYEMSLRNTEEKP